MPNKILQGKLCVITGASSGIGPAIVRRYAEAGATLVLCARREEALSQLANECSDRYAAQCYVHSVDLTNAMDTDAFANAVLQDHQRVDVLVNNAGMGVQGTPLEGNPDDWETMFALNVHAPMRLTRRFAPVMQQRGVGTIVNIGSIAAVEPMTASCAYAATKYALRGWSLSCYQALRHHNIKVMLINPAFVNTPMVAGNPNTIPERMLQPEDIAEVAMLPFTTSAACVPEEITLRLTLSAYKSS